MIALTPPAQIFSATHWRLLIEHLSARYAGYLDFQDQAGDVIHAYLRQAGDPGNTLDRLNHLYRESRTTEDF